MVVMVAWLLINRVSFNRERIISKAIQYTLPLDIMSSVRKQWATGQGSDVGETLSSYILSGKLQTFTPHAQCLGWFLSVIGVRLPAVHHACYIGPSLC
jgi:hypothetical protein